MPRTAPKLTPAKKLDIVREHIKEKSAKRQPATDPNWTRNPQRSPDQTPIWWEQARQAILRESVAIAKAQVQEDVTAKVRDVKRRKIDLEFADDLLMEGAEILDWRTHGDLKLKCIEDIYTIGARCKRQSFELLEVPRVPDTPDSPGTYTALFNRLALPAPPEAPPAPSQEVFDLIPPPKPPEVPKKAAAIDETAKGVTNPNILHVEIED